MGQRSLAGPLRADAQRNLDRILVAARTVFARRGLAATLDEVAEEAGVGVGTVYRRFRDKAELAEAVFRGELQLLVDDAEHAAALADPWESFVAFLTMFVERQAQDCGLADLLSSTVVLDVQASAMTRQLRSVSQHIVARAQASGVLRADFDGLDIPVLGVMLGAVAGFAGQVHPDLWQRYLAIVLDGLHADPARVATAVPALEAGDLARAMGMWCPHRAQ